MGLSLALKLHIFFILELTKAHNFHAKAVLLYVVNYSMTVNTILLTALARIPGMIESHLHYQLYSRNVHSYCLTHDSLLKKIALENLFSFQDF